jgi:sporulation-control protein
MSFFKKALASIGIGNSKVDTLVENSQLYPGQEVRGMVKMQGGDVEQEFNAVHLEVKTSYIKESDDSTYSVDYVIAATGVHQPFVLGKGEHKEFPFSLQLPLNCPITMNKSKVWLETRLEVSMAVDPRDNDQLQILPPPDVATVLEAMGALGFSLREVQCEYNHRFGSDRPFVQDFEFVTSGGPFQGRFDEIEAYFFPDPHHLVVMFELDRKARSLSGLFQEAMGTDERHASVTLTRDDLAQGSHAVADILQRVIREKQ